MKMNVWSRSGIVLGLVVVTVALCRFFPNASTASQAGVYLWLPKQYENYESREIPVSEEEKFWLPADTSQLKMSYFNRYENPYDNFSATLIVAGGDRRSLHRPEICMVGQGWTIEKSEVIPIEIEGQILEVMDLWLKREGKTEEGKEFSQKSHYVYWWVGFDVSTPHSRDRILLSALNNVFKNRNDRWAYPSVMVHADPKRGEEARQVARERAFKFIAKAAPQFQKSFNGQMPEGARPLKEVIQ